MRKPTPIASAPQPTTQPPTTKCASCAHRHDDNHDCFAHTQRTRVDAGRCIVLECDGYQEVGQ